MHSDEDKRYNWFRGVPISRLLLVLGSLVTGCGGGSASYQAALPTRDAVAIRCRARVHPRFRVQRAHRTLGAQATFYAMTRQIPRRSSTARRRASSASSTRRSPHRRRRRTRRTNTGDRSRRPSRRSPSSSPSSASTRRTTTSSSRKPKGAPDSAFAGLLGGSTHQVDAHARLGPARGELHHDELARPRRRIRPPARSRSCTTTPPTRAPSTCISATSSTARRARRR